MKVKTQYSIAYTLIALMICFVLAQAPNVFSSSSGSLGGGDADTVDGRTPGAASGIATLDADTEVVEPANLIVDQGLGTDNLQVKIVNIGDWNMDTTISKTVSIGIEHLYIRRITALIRNDANGTYHDLNETLHQTGAAADSLQGCSVAGTNAQLYRRTGDIFDNVGFDSTSFNRGWVTIWYIESP